MEGHSQDDVGSCFAGAMVPSSGRTTEPQTRTFTNILFSLSVVISAAPRIAARTHVLKEFNRHYLIIFIVAFAAHGLVLLNDGVYWDGWLEYTFLMAKDWNNTLSLFLQSGRPLFALFIWSIGVVPDLLLGFRLVAFLALTLSALLVYQIGMLTTFLSSRTSLFIAILSLAYPAYQVAIEITSGTLYLLCYSLFLVAVFSALRSEQAVGRTHWVLRVISLVLFIFSFTTKSLLVFYFGFMLLWLLYVQRRERFGPGGLPTFLIHRLDFVLLPFADWLATQALFPNYGLFEDYQAFDLKPEDLISNSFRFWGNAINGQITSALQPIVVWLSVFLAVSFVIFILRARTMPENPKSRHLFSLLGFGILLLVLGTLPYVVINVSPSLHGWTTRHALLVALPVAIVIVALLRPVYSNSRNSVSKIGLAIMVTLTIALCWSTAQNYIAWQSRWVKDKSIMLQLSKMSTAKRISVFWIDDKFPLGGESNYRFYEWSSMFRVVWGGESHIGLDLKTISPDFLQKGKPYFIGLFNLEQLDVTGCQALMTIRRGPVSDGDRRLAAHYLWLRFFQPALLNAFLEQVSRLEIQSIMKANAHDCTTETMANSWTNLVGEPTVQGPGGS